MQPEQVCNLVDRSLGLRKTIRRWRASNCETGAARAGSFSGMSLSDGDDLIDRLMSEHIQISLRAETRHAVVTTLRDGACVKRATSVSSSS